MSAPFTLYLHLMGGQTITLPCESFEIVPPGMTDDGIPTPPRLDYTPAEGWHRTVGYLEFRTIAAIEVERAETGSS